MALTIQERLKDLRVECGLTLEQLAEQTHLSKSALGSYEADDFKDISHYALILSLIHIFRKSTMASENLTPRLPLSAAYRHICGTPHKAAAPVPGVWPLPVPA